jgi:hypothetical protein
MNPTSSDRNPQLEELLLPLSIVPDLNSTPIPGRIRWQRVPIGNGDGSSYRFTTPANLAVDGLTMIWVVDEIYAAGRRDGRRDLRDALKRLVDEDEAHEPPAGPGGLVG